MDTKDSLNIRLKQAFREIPDFPKPGILFQDITPVMQDIKLCGDIIEEFYLKFQHQKIDVVVGVESRGFLFGLWLAHRLRASFVPVRKIGKLPYKTVSYKYNLEYGSASIEIHEDAIKPGDNCLIHDDLLATGGTGMAAAKLIELLGGKVVGYAFLAELGYLKGRKALELSSSAEIFSLIEF